MKRAEQIWRRLREAIQPHTPGAIAALNEGASRQSVEQLEALVGAPLPEAFADSLAIHDGQREPSMSAVLFDNEHLLSCAAIERIWRVRAEVLADLGPATTEAPWWDKHLIPATESDGNGFCVHRDSGEVYYHVHDGTMEGPLFPSWLDLLEKLADKIEAGQFELELESL